MDASPRFLRQGLFFFVYLLLFCGLVGLVAYKVLQVLSVIEFGLYAFISVIFFSGTSIGKL